jgi:hypothetical protein
MPKHYVLAVYTVDPHESDSDSVTLEFQGELKKKTKDAITDALQTGNYQLRFRKKVLA